MMSRQIVAVVGFVSLSLVSFLPRPAAAQNAKAALAQFKAAQNAALGAAKIQIKSSRQVALLAIKTFEGTVKSGAFTNGAFTQLTSSLDTYQGAVRDAVNIAGNAQASAAHDALGTLPLPLGGHFPRGFSPGDGGLSDQFRAKIEALLDASTKQVAKRLGKTTTVAEAGGLGLTFRLRSPAVFLDRQWSDGIGGYFINVAPEIDLVIGFSRSIS
jgi:hypothetical protein